jgi:hypothetical protein
MRGQMQVPYQANAWIGLVTILDRERLEESACEDYCLTREIYERMYRSPLEHTSRLRAVQ